MYRYTAVLLPWLIFFFFIQFVNVREFTVVQLSGILIFVLFTNGNSEEFRD